MYGSGRLGDVLQWVFCGNSGLGFFFFKLYPLNIKHTLNEPIYW